MESHQYDGSAFGGFTLVLAKGHAKARFVWDAKELILTVEHQKVQNMAGNGTWEHDAYIGVASSTEVFSEIGSNAETMLL